MASSINNYDKATVYLGMIYQNSFAASHKYSMLGDTSLIKGDFKKAILYYRKSLKINSGERSVWKKLFTTLKKTDKRATFNEYKKFKIISSFY